MWSVSTQKRLFGSGVKQMIIHTQFLQDEKQNFSNRWQGTKPDSLEEFGNESYSAFVRC